MMISYNRPFLAKQSLVNDILIKFNEKIVAKTQGMNYHEKNKYFVSAVPEL